MAFARTAVNLAIARTPVKQGLWTSLAGLYQNNLTTRLNQYGLKYDDILIESDPDIALATKRLPADELQARDRRLKRALDISFKKKPLPEEIQKTLTPLEPYMTTLLDEAKELRLERELLKGPR